MTTSLGKARLVFMRKSLSVHLIEAQGLFVPTLAEVFGEIGLEMLNVSSEVNVERILDEQPDVLFVDADFVNEDPLRLVNSLRLVVPEAIICVYTGERSSQWAKACHFAGATAVFSKNAPRSEIVAGMQEALQRRPYTDARLRDGD
jgi:DNA-binding NarL/FixJ family response regulator